MSDEEIVELYGVLKDSEAVAQRAGVSAVTVLARVRAAGAAVRPRGGPKGRRVRLLLPDSEIVRLYKLGMSGGEVAEKAGCKRDVVYRILRAEGVERRPSAATPRPRAKRRKGPAP